MEVGDLIVCVNNGEITGNNGERFDNVFVELTKNKNYKCLYITTTSYNNVIITVLNDMNIECGYIQKRFKTLSEIRLEKLNELGLNKEWVMEVGDLIVCVNNGDLIDEERIKLTHVYDELTIDKVYKILKIEDFFNRVVVYVLNDKDIERGYSIKRFKTLSEVRLEKLNRLGYEI